MDTSEEIEPGTFVPAKGTTLSFTTEKGVSITATADESGKVIVNLPVGTHTYSASPCALRRSQKSEPEEETPPAPNDTGITPQP